MRILLRWILGDCFGKCDIEEGDKRERVAKRLFCLHGSKSNNWLYLRRLTLFFFFSPSFSFKAANPGIDHHHLPPGIIVCIPFKEEKIKKTQWGVKASRDAANKARKAKKAKKPKPASDKA